MSLLHGFRAVGRSATRVSRLFERTSSARPGLILTVEEGSIHAKRSIFLASSRLNKFDAQGDRELAAFLDDEINMERDAQVHKVLPRIKGFVIEPNGSEVSLKRELDGELITVQLNINDTVEDENQETADPAAENQDRLLKSKPKFQVDLSRKGQVLTFLCSFVEPEESEAAQADEDLFAIEEFYVHDGKSDDAPDQYVANAHIIDENLYNLFMNMLDDRGINNEFAQSLVDYCTSHEHKLYITALEDIRKFLKS